jgi:hypothetical protein
MMLIGNAFGMKTRQVQQLLNESTIETGSQDHTVPPPLAERKDKATQVSSSEQILLDGMSPLELYDYATGQALQMQHAVPIEDGNDTSNYTTNGKELVADGIIEFCKVHSKRGTRQTEHEHAVQAVEAAAFLLADDDEKRKEV